MRFGFKIRSFMVWVAHQICNLVPFMQYNVLWWAYIQVMYSGEQLAVNYEHMHNKHNILRACTNSAESLHILPNFSIRCHHSYGFYLSIKVKLLSMLPPGANFLFWNLRSCTYFSTITVSCWKIPRKWCRPTATKKQNCKQTKICVWYVHYFILINIHSEWHAKQPACQNMR